MSKNLDMDHDAQALAPRPWPKHLPQDSLLTGRRVLVLAADLAAGSALAETLVKAGCSAQALQPAEEEISAHLAKTPWEVVVASPQMLTKDVRTRLSGLASPPAIVLLGDAESPQLARSDMPGAVFAYLRQPVNPEHLLVSIGRALEQRTLELENLRLRTSLSDRFSLGKFVTRSPELREILDTVGTVAETKASVLILGESGTGKTMLAQTIHQHSPRSDGPFIVVNCGALPESLLASELFGHVRGAFTGAIKDKPGCFELADGGTLFLDEINSASPDLQVKLLRVIQEKAFERVGDTVTRKVDVRLITASNQDLEEEIRDGRFREDLFYRIHVVSLALPPLRQRPGDIPLLAEHFIARFAEEYRKPVKHLAQNCLSLLVGAPWPGNVRQLENAIERAVLLSSGVELVPDDFGDELRKTPPGATDASSDAHLGSSLMLGLQTLERLPPLKQALEVPERAIIQRALEINGGNRNRTAEMLEVNRTTLFNKMRKYDLLDSAF